MNEFNERWLPVPDYEGLYEVSNRGRVWSAPRATTRGGLLKLIPDSKGYQWVNPSRDGEQHPLAVHRLVMLAFVGPPLEGQEVRHLDGNPANNHWEPGDEETTQAAGGNLIYGTHAENMEDLVRIGQHYKASMTSCSKGHEYTPENTRTGSKGERLCRECSRTYQREYQREWERRRRAEGKIPPEEQERRRTYQREYMRRRRAEQKRLREGSPEMS